jgi:hypothetical protein
MPIMRKAKKKPMPTTTPAVFSHDIGKQGVEAYHSRLLLGVVL